MKQGHLLFHFFVLFIFCSCRQEHHKDTNKVQDNSPKDTVEKIYWPIDTNKVVKEKKLSMYNESYKLKIITYCLNDSAIVNEIWTQNNSENGAKKTLDISHNYSVNIVLTKDNKEIFAKQIIKDIFKDSVDKEFYKSAKLLDIQYDAVRTNRLYFKATLVVPDKDLIENVRFAIFYQTKKIGQLDFWRIH